MLVAVAFSAVLVTDGALDATDTHGARSAAQSSRDAIGRELDEGDAPDDALAEVITAAEAEGVRLVATTSGRTRTTVRAAHLTEVSAGTCRTLDDDVGLSWRACAVGDARARVIAAIPIAEHLATIALLLRWMAGVVVLGLVALGLAVRRALRPAVAELTSLVRWTDRIVGSESVIAPPAAETLEIARLERAFDALVRRLFDELGRARANSAHIAHELRTPLTSILAELDTLESRKLEAVTHIRADVARLADVIEAILVLSDPHAKSPAGTLVNVADVARDLAPGGAAVEAPDEALLEADERLVGLAIRNLLENAQRHGAGARAVRVSREGSHVRVTVEDAGPGLDERARAQMFERHWRASADGAGRGLGLALVSAVAERYDGKAEAAPGDAGLGLRVSMTLGGLVRWQHQEPTPASENPGALG